MKKLRAFIACTLMLCLLAVLCGNAAAAGAIDLSTLSDEELEQLLTDVQQEIVNRGISKTAVLPKGAYIAGEDLPTGKYLYTCLATGSDWGNVTVYSNRGSGRQLLWEIVSAPENGKANETFYLTLNDGDQLKSGVPFSLTINSKVFFR